MPATEIDFDKTYQFEIEDAGRLYSWSGVKPKRQGDIAIFDWDDGRNGWLVRIPKNSQ